MCEDGPVGAETAGDRDLCPPLALRRAWLLSSSQRSQTLRLRRNNEQRATPRSRLPRLTFTLAYQALGWACDFS